LQSVPLWEGTQINTPGLSSPSFSYPLFSSLLFTLHASRTYLCTARQLPQPLPARISYPQVSVFDFLLASLISFRYQFDPVKMRIAAVILAFWALLLVSFCMGKQLYINPLTITVNLILET
jgi:hypothetical protein